MKLPVYFTDLNIINKRNYRNFMFGTVGGKTEVFKRIGAYILTNLKYGIYRWIHVRWYQGPIHNITCMS
jgi:hypothetical protein